MSKEKASFDLDTIPATAKLGEDRDRRKAQLLVALHYEIMAAFSQYHRSMCQQELEAMTDAELIQYRNAVDEEIDRREAHAARMKERRAHARLQTGYGEVNTARAGN